MFKSTILQLPHALFNNARAVTSERYRFALAVVLSILCHILAMAFSESGVANVSGRNIVIPVKEEEKRLVFEIVESNPDKIVATPPEDARFASDKNTQASDNNPEATEESARPTTEGFADTKELPVFSTDRSNLNEAARMRDFTAPKKFNLSELLRRADPEKSIERNQKEEEKKKRLTAVMPKNPDVSAKELGGMSLSTYAWDFAPYMLKLKRKINRNIHPPKAFLDLGIIDGRYVIQFVITQKGELKSLRVMDSQGSKSLELTSINAIQYSKPFDPLPEHFPDDLLVITGTFTYFVR